MVRDARWVACGVMPGGRVVRLRGDLSDWDGRSRVEDRSACFERNYLGHGITGSYRVFPCILGISRVVSCGLDVELVRLVSAVSL